MNTVETTKLKSALERLLLTVPKRGGNAVLQNVRWSVSRDQISLTASDLDNMVQVSIPLKTIGESNGLDVLIPADILSQVLKGEPSQAVEFAASDGKFEVRAGKQVIVLPCSKADGFPLPPVGETAVARLLGSALRGALAKTLFCVTTEQSRYTLNALKLEIHKSLFRLVATDGHRLSVVEGAAKPEVTPGPCTLVHRATARLLERLLARSDGWVEYSASPPDADDPFDFFLLPDGTRLIGRRSQGQFPNYEAVMPRAPVEATIIFRRQDWIEGLEKLRPVAMKQHNHPVAFEFSNGRTAIKAAGDGTQAQAELPGTRVSGKARTISFNHAYLVQYAKSLETESISMRVFPISICEAVMFDSFRYRHLLMPLRT